MKLARPRLSRSIAGLIALMPLGSEMTTQAQPQRRGLPAPKESVLPRETMDIQMFRFNRLPAVDVTIDGRGPFRLIVDTGAAGVVLDSDLATELKLKPPPGMPEGMHIKVASPGNPNVSAALVHIDRLKLGGAEFRGIWTVATELPFGDDLDGVLGMNVFHKCLLTFDYPGNRIRLKPGTLPVANGRDVLPFSTPGGSGTHPSIGIEIGGDQAQVMMDTGMRGWFSLPAGHARKLGIALGPVPGPLAMFVGGSQRHQVARLATQVRVGHYVVDHPLSYLSESADDDLPGTGPVLGTFLLEHFIVTFDAGNSRVRLDRPSTTPIVPPAMRELGVSLRLEDNQMVVWDVHPRSHAAKLGIANGDVVHEIGGVPAREIYATERWPKLLASEDAIELRFSANGKKKPVRRVDVRIMELLPPAD